MAPERQQDSPPTQTIALNESIPSISHKIPRLYTAKKNSFTTGNTYLQNTQKSIFERIKATFGTHNSHILNA